MYINKINMELINSVTDIKSVKDFSNRQEYKLYLMNTFRSVVNKLKLLADEVVVYRTIQQELVQNINYLSEDTDNNEIMINKDIIDVDDDEEKEEKEELEKECVKDKSKPKKTSKKTSEDESKAKKTTKKIEVTEVPVPEVPVIIEQEKPKAKKTTKKIEVSETPIITEQEKPKAKKTTKKTE